MKAETNIIASLTTSPKGRVLILVMMYIETVKAEVNIFEVTLTDNFHILNISWVRKCIGFR
jgi:hypothetical protein